MGRHRPRKTLSHELTRRERQIMDAVFEGDGVTAKQILTAIPDPPSLDAVRRMIRILEEKGYLRHREDGPRHVYYPTTRPEKARLSAIDHVIRTHFKGSISRAVAALVEGRAHEISEAELKEMTRLIRKARQEGR